MNLNKIYFILISYILISNVITMKCPICNNDKYNMSVIVKEMQQGFREEFEYIECGNCGCLFIKEIPDDLSKYYDINYAPHTHKTTLINKVTDKIYAMYIANNKFIKFIKEIMSQLQQNFGIVCQLME